MSSYVDSCRPITPTQLLDPEIPAAPGYEEQSAAILDIMNQLKKALSEEQMQLLLDYEEVMNAVIISFFIEYVGLYPRNCTFVNLNSLKTGRFKTLTAHNHYIITHS